MSPNAEVLEQRLEALKAMSVNTRASVGPHDQELIDQQVSDLENRMEAIQNTVTGRLQTLDSVISGFDIFVEQIDAYIQWLEDQQPVLTAQNKIGATGELIHKFLIFSMFLTTKNI